MKLIFAALATLIVVFVDATSPQHNFKISEKQALQKAQDFATSRGQFVNAQSADRKEAIGLGNVRLWRITFEKGFGVIVEVDAASGQVTKYRDQDTMEKRRLAGPKKSSTLKDRASAKRRADLLAQKCGLPASWKLDHFDFYLDDAPGKGSSYRIGAAIAIHKPFPGGYPHFNYSPSMRLRIDPLDGRLVEYSFFGHTTTVSNATPKISAERARTIAEAAHARERLASRLAHTASGAPKLGWAVPNGMFGSPLEADTVAPFSARLVYQVPFARSLVWVDAANGKVVGGDVLK